MGNAADGPKVLVVTVPKSGTHLLDSILERMPPMKRQEKVALNAKLRFHPFNYLPFAGTATCMTGIGRPYRVKASAMRHALGRIRPWRYAMAQLPWQPIVMEFVADLGIRPIVVVRDPRDVLVSLMHHALAKPAHFMHRDVTALPTPWARLSVLIAGGRNSQGQQLASTAERLDFILGWVEDPEVLTLRFEDLVGGRGGGSDEHQHQSIRALGDWIQRPVTAREAEEIGQSMFGAGRTFRKGQIGGWREVFDDALRAQFEDLVGDRMKRMGYTHE